MARVLARTFLSVEGRFPGTAGGSAGKAGGSRRRGAYTLLGGWTMADPFRWSGIGDMATEVREQHEQKSPHRGSG